MTEKTQDTRDITTGGEIPSENYCDQPYVVKTDDGAWLCVMTTGHGREGVLGQHVVTMRSTDMGRTWSRPVDVESADGPEASYAVLLKVPPNCPAQPAGRMYCFYNHNTDNTREIIGDEERFEGGKCLRVDTQGHFVFRYSDDHGRTWSPRRYEIPLRLMDIDRENPYQGRIKFFWNVGRPFILNGAVHVPLIKVGGFGIGMFTRSEGALLKSANLLAQDDPAKAEWETLPDGEAGLRAPGGGGPIAEEHSFSVLRDGSLYCVYRTVDGRPACCYSHDGGHTWTPPRYNQYANGRGIRHPRAANLAWRCSNGRFLYWFHNNGTCSYTHDEGFSSRSIGWLCGGKEEAGQIQWSQPEVVLYDPEFMRGCSYPDLVEDDGRFFLTETQKRTARVHEIDPRLLAAVWGELEDSGVTRDGLVLSLGDSEPVPQSAPMPRLRDFLDFKEKTVADFSTSNAHAGFAVELWIRLQSLEAGQVILDSRTDVGRGLALHTATNGTIEIVMNDSRSESRWACDAGFLEAGKSHHVVTIVDGGPRIVSFVIDGVLCDGGGARPFGWGRFGPYLHNVNGTGELRIGPSLDGEIKVLRIYDRYLLTGEAIANFRAGLGDG